MGIRFNPKIVSVKEASSPTQNPQTFFDDTLKKLTLKVQSLNDSNKTTDGKSQSRLNIGNIALLSEKGNQAIALKRKPTWKRKIGI